MPQLSCLPSTTTLMCQHLHTIMSLAASPAPHLWVGQQTPSLCTEAGAGEAEDGRLGKEAPVSP
jgi:hypothetical protein